MVANCNSDEISQALLVFFDKYTNSNPFAHICNRSNCAGLSTAFMRRPQDIRSILHSRGTKISLGLIGGGYPSTHPEVEPTVPPAPVQANHN